MTSSHPYGPPPKRSKPLDPKTTCCIERRRHHSSPNTTLYTSSPGALKEGSMTNMNASSTRVDSQMVDNDVRPGEHQTQNAQNNEGNANWVPRPKRIACVVCRKRKLRCDGNKPSCGSCARLGHDCAYNEVRKKSGPKRGYVKQLEARLAQVETLLKSQDSPDSTQIPSSQQENPPQMINVSTPTNNDIQNPPSQPNISLDPFGTASNLSGPDLGTFNSEFSWEMIGLGLEEPLPTQEVINELNEIYFRKIHPSIPMIHRPRYFAAMNLAPQNRPPVCLRYIMWANAAAVTEKYQSLHAHFYHRARKYVSLDEMKGFGENIITVAHNQCWNLIGMYEFKMMYFPRAWTSCGHGARMALMMGLHRQDGVGLDVKQCLPPPRDWTEREERRRTFWSSFCQDRYGSIGTGWPMLVDERDILTNLPASDQAYISGKPEKTHSLADIVSGTGTSTLSSFGGVALAACLFGRNLHHLHRVSTKDNDRDLSGDFWKRHRTLDNIILSTSLSLPGHLRLPEGINVPGIVFTNMCIHTSAICLHQAALFKAEKNEMPAQIADESKRRCIIAADQITNIMKMVSHTDLTILNPFTAFCLYVASRIFIQYLKSRPEDQPVLSSLQFLLSALNATKTSNPLAESFLVQLDIELEGSGLGIRSETPKLFAASTRCTAPQTQGDGCVSILNPPREVHYTQQSTMHNQTSAPSPVSSLPTRQKQPEQSGPSPPEKNTTVVSMTDCFASALYPNNDQIKSLVMELDGSTDAGSDRQPSSSSNHATPCTNKSSSSSFSPSNNAENTSPPKQQQQQNSQGTPGNIYATTTATSRAATGATAATPSFFDNAFNNNNNPISSSTTSFSHFPTAAEATLDSTGGQNPYALPPGWDFHVRQGQGIIPGETGMTPDADMTFPSLDGVNWAPTPSVTDWNNWTNQ